MIVNIRENATIKEVQECFKINIAFAYQHDLLGMTDYNGNG